MKPKTYENETKTNRKPIKMMMVCMSMLTSLIQGCLIAPVGSY